MEEQKEAPKPRRKRKVNHVPEAKRTRKVEHPPTEKPVLEVEEPEPNKYAPKKKVGTPALGRSPNYVTKVGLGNLTTITAHGNIDV